MRPTFVRARSGAALLAATLLLSPAPAARSDAGAPVAGIERLNAALLDVMHRADELGFEGRREVLTPTIRECFDLPYMAAKATGRHWRELEDRDRARMVDRFSRMTLATYASRFDGYEGEKFEILGEEPSVQGTVLVRSRIAPADEEPVELTYRLHTTPQGWRIIDVFLQGTVSELALRRSDYTSVIKRDGFDALIEGLDGKIRGLESGESK